MRQKWRSRPENASLRAQVVGSAATSCSASGRTSTVNPACRYRPASSAGASASGAGKARASIAARSLAAP
jgi:hypothetical protein